MYSWSLILIFGLKETEGVFLKAVIVFKIVLSHSFVSGLRCAKKSLFGVRLGVCKKVTKSIDTLAWGHHRIGVEKDRFLDHLKKLNKLKD